MNQRLVPSEGEFDTERPLTDRHPLSAGMNLPPEVAVLGQQPTCSQLFVLKDRPTAGPRPPEPLHLLEKADIPNAQTASRLRRAGVAHAQNLDEPLRNGVAIW